MADTPVSALTSRQQKLFNSARTAHAIGNAEFADEACRLVLKEEPGCIEVRRLYHRIQLQRSSGPGSDASDGGGGLSTTPFIFSSASRNPVKALASAEFLLEQDPRSCSALKLLAEAAMNLEYPATAAYALEKVREFAPDDHGNLHDLARAWLACGEREKAVAIVEQLINLRPNDTSAQELLRKVLSSPTRPGIPGMRPKPGTSPRPSPEEDGPEARQQLESDLARAIAQAEEEPDHLEYYRAIIPTLRRLDRLKDALAWTRRVRARPAGATDVELARWESEIEGEILERQMRAAESAMLASPKDPEVLAQVEAARRELLSFRLFEAKRHVELHPEDHLMRLHLADACLASRRFEEAAEHYGRLVNQPEFRVRGLIGNGRALRECGRIEEAAHQFLLARSELDQMDMRKKDVVYRLAECYELQGRHAEAVEHYKSIYAVDIDFRDVVTKINAYFTREQEQESEN